MRNGYNGCRLLFSNSGNLVGVSTGSDACAEHECGAKDLFEALTPGPSREAEVVRRLRANDPVALPHLLESRRIVAPQKLQLMVRESQDSRDHPEALWGFCAQNELTLDWAERSMRFHERSAFGLDANARGAWDCGSFAIRVRGAKYVDALKAFHEGATAGDVVFAGAFFRQSDADAPGGVVLARESFLSVDDRKALAVAQVQFESKLRLRARDDTDKLNRELRSLCNGQSIGYLWAVWADASEQDVMYALNPGYGVKALYYGPYTRQQLVDWVKGGMRYELKPARKAA